MAWSVSSVEEFESWLVALDVGVRREIAASIGLLGERGPMLGRPYADTLKNSAHPNMKELRVQVAGEPWRVFFAFDPKRTAILLLGGNKVGDDRFYEVNLPIADARFTRHLAGLNATDRKGTE